MALAGAGLAACSEPESFECGRQVRQCAGIVEQREIPARTENGEDIPASFALTLRNGCQTPVDIKICFEDTRGTTDCRAYSEVEPQTRFEETKSARFLGQGIKVFLRYSENALICRFPVSERVTF